MTATPHIESFWQEFMQASLAVGSPNFIYRGMSDKTYTLCPSISRHPSEHTDGDVTTLESALLTEFKRLSLRELEFEPENEFEWLFLAQHHGLPTRLLDWSTNPLVGLYFSVEKDDDHDGILYLTRQSISDQYHMFDHRTADYQKRQAIPISLQPRQGKVIFVRPKYKDRRYHNQASVFSCPANPYEALDGDVLDNLESLVVPRTLKPALRERLRMLGVSASFIYPGLDGIAAEVKSLQYDPVHAGRQRIISLKGALDFGSHVTQATLEKDKA
ncbi:hypothetical protein PTKU64_93180 (plasmid) [Paraburkholderia terrae]|uniref:FRG domain-containing protein n=1 Tax=Paraburkholderia terrae TaxID=311230 RepID=A0ABN6JXP3_9BURK|nr:FRG domain-containing protein [Paraburkholderia terrae]BCZ85643.1 hypothetical protein PTKU64_93180 [Paraburkholderia terrae]